MSDVEEMGNSKSRKEKKAVNFFGWQKEQEQLKKQTKAAPLSQRGQKPEERPKDGSKNSTKNTPVPNGIADTLPTQRINYDDLNTNYIRKQLNENIDAFLLNNIMLSMQFFENYQNVRNVLKHHSVTEADVKLNENMAQHHKHVILPDKLQEAIDEHIQFARIYRPEEPNNNDTRLAVDNFNNKLKNMGPLQPQRMYIVHDNIEVNDPGEMADYSTVTGAPFYRMIMESTSESGYVKLKTKDVPQIKNERIFSKNDDKYSGSEEDYASSDTIDRDMKGFEDEYEEDEEDELSNSTDFMNSLKNKIDQQNKATSKPLNANLVFQESAGSGRRLSGILKNSNNATIKGQLTHGQTSKPTSKPKKVRTKVEKVEEKQCESETSSYKSTHSPHNESNGSESDYGYSTFTYEATPKRLQKSHLTNTSDQTSTIPARCFTMIEKKNKIGDFDEDEPYATKYGAYKRELYKKLYYLNSQYFMANFQDLFLSGLAQSLGLESEAIETALAQGASIYSTSYKERNSKSFEIVPAINSTWPSNANEWLNRCRKSITNPLTKLEYTWPEERMVEKARTLGCLLVPVGFRPVRGNNRHQHLQWRIAFPVIERFLETHMAHSQVRCYIFATTLYRTFMEYESSKIGLDYTHFKNHLLWLLEDNFARWPEDKLGEVLLDFLNTFYEDVKCGIMSNYFIPQYNMLKGVPKSILLRQQKRLFEIKETPVMHMLACLKNIIYVKPDFYPQLDFKKLYKILTTTDILQLVNPQIPHIDSVSDEEEPDEFAKNYGFWEDQKRVQNPEYYWNLERQRQIVAHKAAGIVEQQKPVKNIIDRKRKIARLDMNRKRLILQLFIPHFISISDYSLKYEAENQAKFYLEHARRLSVILQLIDGGMMAASEYLSTIRDKMIHINNRNIMKSVPQVPKRNESFSSNTPFRSRVQSTSNSIARLDSDDLDSPTIKFSGITSADVHSEVDKAKLHRTISIKITEPDTEEVVEESRL